MTKPWYSTRPGMWLRRKLREVLRLNSPSCPRWLLWVRTRIIPPEKVIPKGCYCYKWIESPFKSGTGRGKVHHCPFWDSVDGKEEMRDGWCALTRQGDWEGPCGGLLWDQVKCCNINEYDYDVIYIEDIPIHIEEDR